MADTGMSQLTNLMCAAWRKGEPTLTDAEVASVGAQIPGWDVIEEDGIKRPRRVLAFQDFVESLSLTDSVGRLAEEEGHHPDL